MRRWTKEEVAQIRTHWEAGLNVIKIAALFSATRNSIISIAHRHDFPTHAQHCCPAGYTPEERKEVRRKQRKREYARRKERMQTDPEYAAQRRMIVRAWRAKNPKSSRESAGTRQSTGENQRYRVMTIRRHDLMVAYNGEKVALHLPYTPKRDFGNAPLNPNPCNMLELTSTRCRWIDGEPKGFDTVYCGAETFEELSYCAHHARIAYTPVSERILKNRHGKFTGYMDYAA